MKHRSLADARCPIARSLDVVGEWWSLLILRDAFRGVRRFDDFQASLGIARNLLARRLKRLVAAGLLETRPYSTRPPRHEYRLTDKGRDLYPVLMTLLDWGKRWAPLATSAVAVSRRTGAPLDPVLVDRATGEPITPATVAMQYPAAV
ncbi:MAG TPA: helix-turn-helix domain-containing protein [Candidatus Sulfotelmatobacter sp.]|nr:helix-turn-helix domain-containing protein [Candidatus Sulfotelmatobacter sp.]